MIKLVASDIDGTLLPEGTDQINPEMFEVIRDRDISSDLSPSFWPYTKPLPGPAFWEAPLSVPEPSQTRPPRIPGESHHQACIFDFDGTLCDSVESIAVCANHALRDLNLEEASVCP